MAIDEDVQRTVWTCAGIFCSMPAAILWTFIWTYRVVPFDEYECDNGQPDGCSLFAWTCFAGMEGLLLCGRWCGGRTKETPLWAISGLPALMAVIPLMFHVMTPCYKEVVIVFLMGMSILSVVLALLPHLALQGAASEDSATASHVASTPPKAADGTIHVLNGLAPWCLPFLITEGEIQHGGLFGLATLATFSTATAGCIIGIQICCGSPSDSWRASAVRRMSGFSTAASLLCVVAFCTDLHVRAGLCLCVVSIASTALLWGVASKFVEEHELYEAIEAIEAIETSSAQPAPSVSGATARIVDTGESGAVRPSLAGFFRAARITPLRTALAPVPEHHMDSVLSTCMLRAKQGMRKHPHLTQEEAAALCAYTTELNPQEESPYWGANKALRSMRRRDVMPWVDFIWLLLNAMAKLPPAPFLTVFRGMKKPIEELGENFQAKATLVLAGFTSASTKVEAMESFIGKHGPRVLMHLHLRRRGRSFEDFSFFPGEFEIVLPPNTTFYIDSTFNAGNGLTIIQAQEIEPVEDILRMSG